jgi:3'-phosphoadenosine 5'-phosphosulfate sulfotransferase (PAPS reductase)/FAD synthetase
MSIIVAISGGTASGYCSKWVLENYLNEEVILYFNDTKWEHPDLYRFLEDLEKEFHHSILWDSDGRSPEQLFYDHHALANDRMPFCSRELKAKRLQKFYKNGDTLVFGIGADELHRARRIVSVYQVLAAKTGKYANIVFPLITQNVSREQVNKFFIDAGIKIPALYQLGFSHNNCSGGCVRAGKKQWKLLLEKLPEVYADRERVEEEIRKYLEKDIHFFKDETLKHFRERILQKLQIDFDPKDDNENEVECVGICDTQS